MRVIDELSDQDIREIIDEKRPLGLSPSRFRAELFSALDSLLREKNRLGRRTELVDIHAQSLERMQHSLEVDKEDPKKVHEQLKRRVEEIAEHIRRNRYHPPDNIPQVSTGDREEGYGNAKDWHNLHATLSAPTEEGIRLAQKVVENLYGDDLIDKTSHYILARKRARESALRLLRE
jgi:hypothetical protein